MENQSRREFLEMALKGVACVGATLLPGCRTLSGNRDDRRQGGLDRPRDIGDIPVVELHRHLEAGLSPEMVAKYGQKNGVTEIRTYKGEILPLDPQDPDSIRSYYKSLIPGLTTKDGFMKFLASLTVPLSVIKSLEDLSEVTRLQIREQAAKGCMHLELRGSPYTYQSCVDGNPSYEEVIRAIQTGMRDAYVEDGLSASHIACFSKQRGDKYGKGVAEAVLNTHTDSSPVGIDLAGVEAGFPPSKFKDILAPIIEAGIPITVHAGEQSHPPDFEKAPPSFIREAIELGARRIGHGTSLIADRDLMDLCRERTIHIETCPGSNNVLGYMPIAEHPLKEFLEHGISASVGTDDPLMFGDDSVRELLQRNQNALKITPEDVAQMTRYAIEAAFVSEVRREELRRKFNSLY